ncbi:MAG: hypothetical protein SVG88_14120 [Halobacteriales archaeon]|nr:hypothetical protein [Halobacteriales archaeon]
MTHRDRETADFQPLNEETPPSDAPVAVEWWHRFDAEGEPELDTFHGFHDATEVDDGDPPAVTDGELVNKEGVPINSNRVSEDLVGSRYLYMTHKEALARDISPCIECFPAYATERRLEEERDGGILAESGVEGAVFVVQTRQDLGSDWEIDSVHESYTSMLYRTRAIRQQVESTAERLRLSFRPIRRCEYDSVQEAVDFEPAMQHVSKIRKIQPDELPKVREVVGESVIDTRVAIESRRSMKDGAGLSVVHQAEDAPCGYEQAFDFSEDDSDELEDVIKTERETVEKVIKRGALVDFCSECFPSLAAWSSDANEN